MYPIDTLLGLLPMTQSIIALLRTAIPLQSPQVGDEYAERTGRARPGYTRHEAAAGISWIVGTRARVLLDGGWGYLLSNEDIQEPGRAQRGIELSLPTRPLTPCTAYATVDACAMEERDWRIDTALQLGLLRTTGARTWRFALEYYRGRPSISDIFQYTGSYAGVGVWIEI